MRDESYIKRSKRESNFTIVNNDIFKSGLSVEALGTLLHVLHFPNDWIVYKTELRKTLNVGRDKLDNIFKEIQSKGYMAEVKIIREKGKFSGASYIFYDSPVALIDTVNGFSGTGFQYTDNPQLLSTNEERTNKQNIPYIPKGEDTESLELPLNTESSSKERKVPQKERKPLSLDEKFNTWWAMHPKKESDKGKTFKKWQTLNEEDKDMIIAGFQNYVESVSDKMYLRAPLSFLNNGLWKFETWGKKPKHPSLAANEPIVNGKLIIE